jgi:hypothetical protein
LNPYIFLLSRGVRFGRETYAKVSCTVAIYDRGLEGIVEGESDGTGNIREKGNRKRRWKSGIDLFHGIAMTAEYPDAAMAAAVIALMISTGAVSKFNLMQLIITSEIDRAYAALTDPVASGS